MKKFKELNYKELKYFCDSKKLKFKTTSDFEPEYESIGQDRAVAALEFGLKMKVKGYNIYMSGPSGTGKTNYAAKYIRKIAAEQEAPDDWCYVYNFKIPNQPTALNLKAGMGSIFQKDMENLIKVIQVELPKAFDSEDYEREEAEIIREFQEKRVELIDELDEQAEKLGFRVKNTNTGIYFLPVVDGKVINDQDFNELDEHIRHEINLKSDSIQLETMDMVRRLKEVEHEVEEKLSEWQNKVAMFALGIHIDDLKSKYSEYPKIQKFLDDIQENIIKNLEDFIGPVESDEQASPLLPLILKKEENPYDKYKINLIVDNSGLNGAPVIINFNPTYYNLMGKFEYENEFGTVSTDFSMIKAGLFHQANGGYLILQAKDLLMNVQAWESLKRVLKTRQITIENMKEQMGLIAMSALKPDPIPVDIKVILVGNSDLYQVLLDFDDDFSKLFKIKADFNSEMDINELNINKLCQFISSFCQREQTLPLNKSAVANVIEYSSRLVEDQRKMTTKYNDLVELLAESSTWAKIEGASVVSGEHVEKAIKEKAFRSNKYDQMLLELMEEGTIMIDTEGAVVGQINGLSVLDMGDFVFGKPSRITANTYLGKSGIVNIEREVEMSGTTHTKGVLILSAYIGEKFAQDVPLALTASICFEQLYSGIEGDSASSTELFAILSSLSGLPINQGIAVTGSVNQKGEIQPIGGATHKIEGFFELCKSRGLTGSQGIILPYKNIINLNLDNEVIQAVKDGKFHIYPIKTIDEGIEILTGVPAGVKKEDGTYPKGTVNFLVAEKLRKYAMAVIKFGDAGAEKGKKVTAKKECTCETPNNPEIDDEEE
ncbi:MAG: Lon protease family protein [Deltaproteobacteria bacterium]